ncbi:hypothetical protein HBDW_32890 [Herbaspirillum sp. DW155]|uniref:hypothetical protein n=1 Tax=Herbaspirillum sp. DW155 TaxID=3095609 RepID=UPI00308AF240|nr:hypothetical protein HBDW_32890 [Herbaspirillum sp. DW155]
MSNRENLSKHGVPRSPAAFPFYWPCAATLLAAGMVFGLAAKAQQRIEGDDRSLAAGLGIARAGFDAGLQLDSLRLQDMFFGIGGVGEMNLSAPGKGGEIPLSGGATRMNSGWSIAVARRTHETSRFELLAERDSPVSLIESAPGTPRPPWPFKPSISYRIKASWRF